MSSAYQGGASLDWERNNNNNNNNNNNILELLGWYSATLLSNIYTLERALSEKTKHKAEKETDDENNNSNNSNSHHNTVRNSPILLARKSSKDGKTLQQHNNKTGETLLDYLSREEVAAGTDDANDQNSNHENNKKKVVYDESVPHVVFYTSDLEEHKEGSSCNRPNHESSTQEGETSLFHIFKKYYFPKKLFCPPNEGDSIKEDSNNNSDGSGCCSEEDLLSVFEFFIVYGEKCVTRSVQVLYFPSPKKVLPEDANNNNSSGVINSSPIPITNNNNNHHNHNTNQATPVVVSRTPDMLMGYASASSNGGESPGSPTQALQGTTPASYKISIGSASSGNAETHNNNTNSAIIPDPTFPEEEKELKSICVSVLQLLTALAFNCPCTPLSTAAQLLLSRAITTALQQSNDNPNKNEKVWERIPFLALLPRLTGQSEVLQTFAPVTATHSAVPPLRGKDTLLLLDTHGTARVTSIQQWQQEQTAGGGSTVLVLGPQPATTVLFLYERTLFNAAYASRDSERLLHCLQLAEEESKQYWSILPSPLLQARSDYHSTAHPPVLLWGGQQGAVSHPNRQRRPMAEIPGLGQEQQTQKYMQTKQLQRQHALLCALGKCRLALDRPLRRRAQDTLYAIFTDLGEVPLYYQSLALFPDVLQAHHNAMQFLFFGDGPLAVEDRLMVAIMAAARHRCEYLVSRFSALLERYLSQIGEGPEEDGGATYGAQDRREAEVEETGSQSCSDDDLFNSSPVLNSLTGGPSHGGSNHQSRGVSQQRYFNSSATQLSNTNNNYLSANTSYVASIDDVPKRFWLSNGPPARLRHVREFIAHAVHTPWVVSEDEVKDILRTGWTVPELFQLVALLAEVIPITSYVAGLFVPTEPWTSVVLSPAWTNAMPHVATAEDLTLTNAVVPVVSAAPPPQKPSRVTSRTTLDAVCLAPASPEEEQLLTATPTMLARHYSGGRGAAPEEVPWSKASDVFLRYTGEDDIYSTQRIRSRDTLRTLWRRQFSWSEIGALHMEQYYPSAARYLSEELERYNDTVRTLQEGVCVGLRGRSDITPSYTLHSLSTYIQNLMGFMIEDYPYNDINKILRRPSKWLAQVLTLRPETLSRVDVMSWFTSPYNNNNNNNTNSGRQNSEGANNNTNTNNNPAGETFQSHQLRREIELLAEVKPNFFNKNPVVPLSGATSSGGGSTPHNGSLSQPPASLTPNHKTTSLLTPAAEEPDNNNNNKELENMTEMVSGALSMQDEHIILWIALTTMEARKEGLLHLLLHPLYMTLNNM